MPSPIEAGDIVWLDPECGGENPSGQNSWWRPGQERYQWVVVAIQPWSAKMKKLKYPWIKIERLDNGLAPFHKRHRGVPVGNRWIDVRWLRKDEFLSAVRHAKHNKGEHHGKTHQP